MPKMQKKAGVLIFLFLGVFVMLVVAAAIYFFLVCRIKTVGWNELRPTQTLGLLAVKNTNPEYASFTTYRFSDKEKQEFPGTTWQYTFTSPREAIIFGFHPDNREQQHFLIL